MAIYKIFPFKDTSLYSMYPNMNTGIDPILQVSNLNFSLLTAATIARSLVEFDTTEIQNVIEGIIVDKTWEVYFRNFIATAQGVVETSIVEVYPAAQSWNNGTGTYLDAPLTTDGASWNSNQFENGTNWLYLNGGTFTSSSAQVGVPSFKVTGSYSAASSSLGGGNWVVSSSAMAVGTTFLAAQSFGMRSPKDLNVSTTSTVQSWYSASTGLGGIKNNGFIVKWEDSIEFNPNKQVQPVMQYYSVDTNTIYPPELEFKWDDSTWATGSSTISELFQPNCFVALAENPGVFLSESINRFRLNVRPKYPKVVFATSSLYTKQSYLPSGSSLYAVKDLDTDEYVINFDSQYTNLSADTTSSYFDIYMNGLEPERYYKILIQATAGGSTTIYDDNYYFKVSNG
tara:strand:+ start:3053 stop:4249 length:1197 start_codon:yes stop_codon:yes gene_type:complete